MPTTSFSCINFRSNAVIVLCCTIVLCYARMPADVYVEAGCNAEGKLQIGQQDLLSIFITSTAEMPGMVFSSLLVDFLGRKR